MKHCQIIVNNLIVKNRETNSS